VDHLPGEAQVNVRSAARLATMLALITSAAPSLAAPGPSPSTAQIASPQPNPKADTGQAKTNWPLSIRVEPIAPLKLETGSGPPWWTYWIAVVGPLISGVLAYLGVRLSLAFAQRNTASTIAATQQTSDASLWQRANEAELKDILGKLDGFYGPFMQMSQANHLMIEEFRSRQPEGFRTLPHVFDRAWLEALPKGDRKVIAEICDKAAELQKFIADKAGMVDEKVLPYLARASAHFRILYLAHKGELGEDPTNFRRYVYPKELDGVLKLEVRRLRARCDTLRAKPGSPPGSMSSLEIPSNLALEAWPAPTDIRLYPPHETGNSA
jgi:hypothetical protein